MGLRRWNLWSSTVIGTSYWMCPIHPPLPIALAVAQSAALLGILDSFIHAITSRTVACQSVSKSIPSRRSLVLSTAKCSMSRPRGRVLDLVWTAGLRDHELGELPDAHADARGAVEVLTGGARRLPSEQVRAHDVLDGRERTRLVARAVDRQWAPFEAASREDRYDASALGGILAAADDVVIAQDGVVQAERLSDDRAVGLAGQLAHAVQRHRPLRAVLGVSVPRLAEHRAGRRVDEPPNAVASRAQQEPQSAELVDGEIELGVVQGNGVLRRGLVEHAVDSCQVHPIGPVEHALGDQLKARVVEQVVQVARRAIGSDEVVDAGDAVLACE